MYFKIILPTKFFLSYLTVKINRSCIFFSPFYTILPYIYIDVFYTVNKGSSREKCTIRVFFSFHSYRNAASYFSVIHIIL